MLHYEWCSIFICTKLILFQQLQIWLSIFIYFEIDRSLGLVHTFYLTDVIHKIYQVIVVAAHHIYLEVVIARGHGKEANFR